jgi:hypothetical protein
MGRAHCLVHSEVVERIYAERELLSEVQIIDNKAFDNDGLRLIQVISMKLPPGNNGMQDLIIEGGEVRFQPDTDV